ncbi:unnamed protein product, partial [Didymodactylos carnosus]
YFELIYECVDQRFQFLNIISLNLRSPREPDIDLAILQALLNATSALDSGKEHVEHKLEQLQLALEWDRVDIAKNHIMTDGQDWSKTNLNTLFSIALERNQTEFVQLFLDHDFSLTDLFHDNSNLLNLYIKLISTQTNDPLRTIYSQYLKPQIGDFFEIEAVLSSSTYDHENSDSNEYAKCSIKSYSDKYYLDETGKRPTDLRPSVSVNSTKYMDIDKELFIWSVLSGKHEFALLFWSRSKNKICAALLAVRFYKEKAKKELDEKFKTYADEFEQLAVDILDLFYKHNPKECATAMIRQIPSFGNSTWLQMAVCAKTKLFISHKAVQDALNNIWYGYIDVQKCDDITIIFASFMLWFSGFLKYHDERVKVDSNRPNVLLHKKEENHLRSSLSHKNKSNQIIDSSKMARPKDEQGDYIEEFRAYPTGILDFNVEKMIESKITRYFSNILQFMRAPYVKYLYNLYFHVVFLMLFSYIMLCDFFPIRQFDDEISCQSANLDNDNEYEADKIKSSENALLYTNKITKQSTSKMHYGIQPPEILLVFWIFTLLCEEIRQLCTMEAQTIRGRIFTYLSEIWNKLDVLVITLFFIGFILRLIPVEGCFNAARIVLSIDLSIWYMRTLDIFAAVKRLGPKLVMISEMVHDLKFFVMMLTVFILAFGVSSYGLIYGVQPFSWHLPRKVFHIAYWQIFGELKILDEFEDSYKATGYTVFVLLSAYMAIASVLLVNLLIAMFSNTFDRLQTDTDRIWKFQRFSLVYEYLTRPSLPPPLIIFSHLWRFGIWSWDVTTHDVCAICRTPLSESCLRCQSLNKLDECVVVWGDCNHSFHNCCMSEWLKQRPQCPLCQTDWVIQRIGN